MEGPTPKGHSFSVMNNIKSKLRNALKEPHLNVAMGLQTLRGTELGRFPFETAVAIWKAGASKRGRYLMADK